MNGHGWTWQLQLLEEKQVSRTMSPCKDTFSRVFGKGFTLIWLKGLSDTQCLANVLRILQLHVPLI